MTAPSSWQMLCFNFRGSFHHFGVTAQRELVAAQSRASDFNTSFKSFQAPKICCLGKHLLKGPLTKDTHLVLSPQCRFSAFRGPNRPGHPGHLLGSSSAPCRGKLQLSRMLNHHHAILLCRLWDTDMRAFPKDFTSGCDFQEPEPKSGGVVPPRCQCGGTREPRGFATSSHLSRERLGSGLSVCWVLLTSNGCPPSRDGKPKPQARLSHGAASLGQTAEGCRQTHLLKAL